MIKVSSNGAINPFKTDKGLKPQKIKTKHIKQIYEKMINDYSDKIGEKSMFGVIISERMLNTLAKRYNQLCSTSMYRL